MVRKEWVVVFSYILMRLISPRLLFLICSFIICGVAPFAYSDDNLLLRSSKKDPIGKGVDSIYLSQPGQYRAAKYLNFPGTVVLSYEDEENDWYVYMGTADGSELVPGTYENAGGPIPLNGRPYIRVESEINGDYRYCNQVAGRFTVFAVEYNSDGYIQKLSGNFSQQCCPSDDPCDFKSSRATLKGVIRVGVGNEDEHGDTNCDGSENWEDIDSFIGSLIDPFTQGASDPSCTPEHSDVNNSGHIDFDDIDAFLSKR